MGKIFYIMGKSASGKDTIYKELIEKTGGIVQGMSGSPIVQDGVLIGAITHVFVQDPTRGYAVHSRFMFDKAQSTTCSLLDDIRDEIRVAA